MANFDHVMKFSKNKGFSAIVPLGNEDTKSSAS